MDNAIESTVTSLNVGNRTIYIDFLSYPDKDRYRVTLDEKIKYIGTADGALRSFAELVKNMQKKN